MKFSSKLKIKQKKSHLIHSARPHTFRQLCVVGNFGTTRILPSDESWFEFEELLTKLLAQLGKLEQKGSEIVKYNYLKLFHENKE